MPEARFWVTTTAQLESRGALGEIWRCIDHEDRPYGMAEFETVEGAETTPREQALGRRWQVAMPDRWAALSPLGVRRRPGLPAGTDTSSAPLEDDELAREWERRRAQERAEAEQETQDAYARRHGAPERLRSDGGSDLIDGPQDHDDEREEPWR